MFRDFFKRRKRVKEDEVSSATVPGQYTQTDCSSSGDDRRTLNERCDGKENIVNGSVHELSTGGSVFNIAELFEKKKYLPNPLNTLRRTKYHPSDIKERKDKLGPNVDTKNEVKRRKKTNLNLYRSSPSLLGPDFKSKAVNKRKSEGDKYFPNQLETGSDVLQYTNWDTYGSLITLNFGEDDRVVKTEFVRSESLSRRIFQNGFLNRSSVIQSECESNIYEEYGENEDSGTFCDSDSGISSLYETIMKYQTLPSTSNNRNSFVWQQTIEEADLELGDNDTASANYLEKLRIDSELVHIFQRNYKTIYTSRAFAMEFDILTEVPMSSNNLAREQESVPEIKQGMLKMVTGQQKTLETMLTKRKTEKEEVDDSIRQLVDMLIKGEDRKIYNKLNRHIDQIDSLVNLVFGLELKTAETRKTPDVIDLYKNRLEEALVIKKMHDDNFNVIVKYFETNNKLLLEVKIRLKQKLICEIRLLKQELYYLEMQPKIMLKF